MSARAAGPGKRPRKKAAGATATRNELAQLEETWALERGLWGRLREVNHKVIGKRYIITAFVFMAFAGLEALTMRLQLSAAERTVVTNDMYNQLFSTHGSTMMFLFAVPVMQGLAIWLIPLMIGSRELAFPRLNAFTYWVYLFGGVLLYGAFLVNMAPETGWFAYVPLSGPEFSPGKRTDVWAQVVTLTEIAALGVAINLIATIFKHRAPGMTLSRMPLFVWAMLVQSFMVIFAMPAVMLASLALALDRLVGTHFFNPAEGGDALLYQHLFWFFGHPEVYLIMLPANGMMSTITMTFARRPVIGYLPLVLSLVTTAFLGFGLWVHHMFATGLPQLGQSFFTAASMMIAVPTGLQVFCWLATLWTGRVRIRAPLLWITGFFTIFVLGGLSGVTLASVPFDLQVHDTHFVTAHFHYVLIGGAVFPLLGGITFWFPKMTGRMMSERMGRWAFAITFIGFNLTFFPLHKLGLLGMPRRVYTYLPGLGWETLNLVATIGAFTMGVGIVAFVLNALWSRRNGVIAGDDPWLTTGLEWKTTSPPPVHNFAPLPVVTTRYTGWTSKTPEKETEAEMPVVTGLRVDRKEVLVTTLLDAEPDHRAELPGPAIAPLVVASGVAVAATVSMFTPMGALIGSAIVLAGVLGWSWPQPPHREEILEETP